MNSNILVWILFNGISAFLGYVMQELNLKKNNSGNL